MATLKRIEVLSAPHLKPSILRSIRSGDYERPEIEFGLANLRPGDRVVEMGTGAGIVGSVFSKHIKDLKIRSYEANPDLIDHIRALYAHNEVGDVVSVTNNIVVSGEHAPDQMDFFVRSNFLGSRLSAENTENDARKVSVATKHYDEITREYPHNVLVMDIEGGELEFLADANLSGVELVMLELHPKVYGGNGRQQVIEHLTRKGFTLDEATSRGQVASFKKPARMKLAPDFSQIGSGRAPQSSYNLDPHEPLADQIINVDHAVLAKTPRSEGFRISASVFDADRNPVPEAICWMSHRLPATVERAHPRANRIVPLSGTWLFGGRYHPHFGHFLMETLARLWALDYIDEPIEGMLFFPAYNGLEASAAKIFAQLSEVLDIPVNYKLCDAFYRVDRLIVPPQGSGIGRLTASSPEMRAFIAKHLKRDLDPLPAHKLYISRSEGFGKVGRGVLGERRLEALLQDEGYTIFHPQKHSWRDQMRHYLSASHILGTDGSAFHLVNFTGRKDVNVGVIQRRPGHDAKQMAHQAQLYGVENATDLSHLGRFWACAGGRRAGLTLTSELRLAPLCDELKARGFVRSSTKWDNMTDAELEQELRLIATEADTDMRRVGSAHDTLSDYPARSDGISPKVFMSMPSG
ncbi:FkbM family methyltransferase [Aliiroseovarius sp. Z3]|uniref:FkbM family methyltransferase n=1 Tax=Aliiroseovarius sp. Z3 TaxID=2811402 RepID=UPI0023B2CD8C|nr:FkbM family methyltransferase [Aliiroseovarius sp. Z3]MDE9451613.1 FkbM family methyltransferase [Aliiroseovarius sp. Z3]